MDIAQIAMLARLRLSESEEALFSKQVGSIIGYIDKLNELDTVEIEPTAHILPLKNVFREDRVTASLFKDSALQNAPDREEDFYRVPKIIE